MAFTQTDLDALDAARKQGARRVRFQDREFEFDSVDDYLKLTNLILNDVAQQSGPQQVRGVRIHPPGGGGQKSAVQIKPWMPPAPQAGQEPMPIPRVPRTRA